MYCRLAALAIPVCAILVCGGCGQAAREPQKTAVQRFENLGNADDDWQGRALSELLKRRLGADRMPRAATSAPGISSERIPALDAGATRLITGYYSNTKGVLNVTAFAEDARSEKLTGPVHVSGALPTVVDALARQFGGSATASLQASSPGLRDYALASDQAGAAAVPLYELSLQADPNFGPAYLGLLQSDPAHAQQTLAAAYRHAASFSRQDRAALQLESATLARDNRARVDALAALVALDPNDAQALRALGDAEMAVRKPAEASRHYRQAIALTPLDPALRNLLAYAAMYAGDQPGAIAAAADYRRLSPQDPNTLDTAGDIHLAFGQFAAAEKFYAATPWKAARARLMSGDVAGASALFATHLAQLEKVNSPIAGYRAAKWLYITGHRPEGTAAMARFAASTPQLDIRSAAYAQAAIWAALVHDDAHATEWSGLAMKPAFPLSYLSAALARFLAHPSANAETVFSGPNAANVRGTAIGLRLLQSRSFEQAVPVWKQVYENTGSTDEAPMYLYGWALLESRRKADAAPLLQLNPIPSAGIEPTLEALYYPVVFEWRKASLRQ